MKYIISHDIGTSSIKTVLVDTAGNIVANSMFLLSISHPFSGWIEQDPNEYWYGVCQSTKELLIKAQVDNNAIIGMVFVTQAMGIIPVGEDGTTLYNNISWADSRAEKQALRIMRKFGGRKIFTSIIGTPIMGKDVIAKLCWLKENLPEIYNQTKFFLDVNGFLKYKCTDNMCAELSGASSYGLNLRTKKYLSIFKLVGIDSQKLPPLIKSTDIVGGLTHSASQEIGLNEGIPVLGGCDDVQGACIGSGMVNDGDTHICIGSSAWVCASSKKRARFKDKIVALQSADPVMSLIVGVTESAGSNVDWLTEQFFPIEKKEWVNKKIYQQISKQIENIAPGSNHLIYTPWIYGERCPISTTTTRATIFNINPEHTREHLLKSAYEGVGYNLRWILEKLQRRYNLSCDNIRLIGGGAENSAWMQIISDIIGREFSIVRDAKNVVALGGAIIALIGLGYIKDFISAKDTVKLHKHYTPNLENASIYSKLFADYKNIYFSLEKAYEIANSERF